jgi:hydroxypyruvate reductase
MRISFTSQQHPTEFLRQLFEAAVARAQPLLNLPAVLPSVPHGRTVVVGAGKAAGAMAQALEQLWPMDAPLSGVVVTRYHHTPPRPEGLVQRIEVLEAAHPVPDAAGVQAAERILALVQGLQPEDLVICLISGGGSALLTLPAEGLRLVDKQQINRALLESGANITEMNTVRKHLSRIKGGRLAAACHPAQVVTLTISDVPGDDPAVIASGPTVVDASTCAQALAILARYKIDVPAAVDSALRSGLLETPKPGNALFNGHQVRMLATPMQSLQAAAEVARAAGLNAYILSDEIEGESREVGKVHAALARAAAQGHGPFQKPCVILSGGETTVTVRPQASNVPRGKGGRAGEFGLGLAVGLQGQGGVWGLAADTDGIDGVEDNAGVVVTPDSLQRADHLGLKPATFLDRNDSYRFFEALDDLVVTGPTHTNVNDFRALLVL